MTRLAASDGPLFLSVGEMRAHYRRVRARLDGKPLPEPAPAHRRPMVKEILAIVARRTGTCELAILAPGRRRGDLVRVRRIVMVLAERLTERPYAEIARALRRERTTVLYGIRALTAQARQDPDLRAELFSLESEIRAHCRGSLP